MDSEYKIEIDTRLSLDATPVSVKSLSFATPRQTIASVLSETHSIILFEGGKTTPTTQIKVSEDPVEITGGGRDRAYVACRAARTVDVIDASGVIQRIDLPGEPQSLAWNGSFNPTKQKILVACEPPNASSGIVCVIDEETLTISNMLKVGKSPRGVSLDWQRKNLLVANCDSDSISIIDQSGEKVLATLPTAGRPWTSNVSWADPQDIIISLRAGGVLQRMDGSRFPPVLSGLTALRKPTRPPSNITPYCCTPLDEDHLWIVPDQYSESLALVMSQGDEFKQIGYYVLGDETPGDTGLGEIAISGHGLPGSLCIANRKRKEIMFATLRKTKIAALS